MLITPAYIKEQKRLHKTDPDYACLGHKWAYLVAGIAVVEGCKSILDYGCGKGTFAKEVMKQFSPSTPFWIEEYDPAVDIKAVTPYRKFDLVSCTDVLEHIEPECLREVLLDITNLTTMFIFVVISTKFTKGRWLSDGRNSHLIVNEGGWWEEQFVYLGWRVNRVWNTGVKEWVALLEKTK